MPMHPIILLFSLVAIAAAQEVARFDRVLPDGDILMTILERHTRVHIYGLDESVRVRLPYPLSVVQVDTLTATLTGRKVWLVSNSDLPPDLPDGILRRRIVDREGLDLFQFLAAEGPKPIRNWVPVPPTQATGLVFGPPPALPLMIQSFAVPTLWADNVGALPPSPDPVANSGVVPQTAAPRPPSQGSESNWQLRYRIERNQPFLAVYITARNIGASVARFQPETITFFSERKSIRSVPPHDVAQRLSRGARWSSNLALFGNGLSQAVNSISPPNTSEVSTVQTSGTIRTNYGHPVATYKGTGTLVTTRVDYAERDRMRRLYEAQAVALRRDRFAIDDRIASLRDYLTEIALRQPDVLPNNEVTLLRHFPANSCAKRCELFVRLDGRDYRLAVSPADIGPAVRLW